MPEMQIQTNSHQGAFVFAFAFVFGNMLFSTGWNQNLYFCRTRNLLFYGLEGGKDLVVHKWRHLMDSVRVICTMLDGQKVRDDRVHRVFNSDL